MEKQRVLVWFSCGIVSAYSAKKAVEKYRQTDRQVEVLYCDTLKYEHPDNERFLLDVEKWIGQPIIKLNPIDYTGFSDIYDVFDRTGWLVGPAGARCTTELKKKVRLKYQRPNDIHIFGYTIEEAKRIQRFTTENFELTCDWLLFDIGVSKQDCLTAVASAGIQIPAMYTLGFKNNNCIGCVKGGAGYWNRIKKFFPESFEKMAQQERKMGVRILKKWYLDELPENVGRYESEYDIECGVLCQVDRD